LRREPSKYNFRNVTFDDPRPLRTATELRALAHPLRAALLELLAVDGPLTATQCADLTGESPANCSWHLRQLAKYGFVEEAGGGVGRKRPWRAVTRGLRFDDDRTSREVSEAGRAVAEIWLEHEVQRYRAYLERQDAEPTEWHDAATVAQTLAWLTLEELLEFREAIGELLARHIERTDPTKRPADARLVRLLALAFPDREVQQ
jgi:predicted ArsR family transcriptional regulator